MLYNTVKLIPFNQTLFGEIFQNIFRDFYNDSVFIFNSAWRNGAS